MKIWFRLVQAFKSYRGDKPNDTRTRTKFFKVKCRSSPISALKNVEAKRKVEEAKRMSNFKWEQDFDRSYEEDKNKFWKEVRRVRKGGLRTEETVKDV